MLEKGEKTLTSEKIEGDSGFEGGGDIRGSTR